MSLRNAGDSTSTDLWYFAMVLILILTMHKITMHELYYEYLKKGLNEHRKDWEQKYTIVL